MKRLLFLLVLGYVYVDCSGIEGRAFYCRDPDTGKLHGVNTTWAALSFCGNYTCSLRRRNVTPPPSTAIREFNVTKLSEANNNDTEIVNVTIEKKNESDVLPVLHKIMSDFNNISRTGDDQTQTGNNSPSKNNIMQYKPKGHNCRKKFRNSPPNSSNEKDRYLTEKEIDSIADMLHTVKKSDLDAIVDIYNLAHDIYHEMDVATTEELKTEVQEKKDSKLSSYWYDPLLNKGRMSERLDVDLQNINSISTERSNHMPYNNIYGRPPYYEYTIKSLPSYYPVAQQQRTSSYTKPTHSFKTTTQKTDLTKQSEVSRYDYHNKNKAEENNNVDSRKLIKPSRFLPYPFTSIRPYNLTESRNVYYGNPWMLDYYNRYKYYQPYFSTYFTPEQKAILVNPHLNNEVENVEQNVVIKKKEIPAMDTDTVDSLLKGQIMPNWKTASLPTEVLKDIRADIDTSKLLKAFPLRKKMKLERVGKLINLDDLNSHVNRSKRNAPLRENITNYENFETYLEKVTCQEQTEVGYFRIGNLTQPFPECCPQLIDAR